MLSWFLPAQMDSWSWCLSLLQRSSYPGNLSWWWMSCPDQQLASWPHHWVCKREGFVISRERLGQCSVIRSSVGPYFVEGSSNEAIITTVPSLISFRNLTRGATSAGGGVWLTIAGDLVWTEVVKYTHPLPTCQRRLSCWAPLFSLPSKTLYQQKNVCRSLSSAMRITPPNSHDHIPHFPSLALIPPRRFISTCMWRYIWSTGGGRYRWPERCWCLCPRYSSHCSLF